MKRLENIVKGTGRFLKKNFKKIGLVSGGLVLSGVMSVGYLGLRKEGKVINGDLDGKIDKMYYHSLVIQNAELKDISKIDDLLAEVHYLNTGRKISEDFRFVIYEEEGLRVRIARYFGGRRISGLNWGNEDIYMRDTNLLFALPMLFHEMGHGSPDGIIEYVNYVKTNLTENTEPLAEKNVVDSMISLMYLDPEIGYAVYSDWITKKYNKNGFKYRDGLYDSAEDLNSIRCMKAGDFEISTSYDDKKHVKRIVDGYIKNEDFNELIKNMFSGMLSMFEKRFSSKEDFNSKYSRLEKYFEFGLTDSLCDRTFEETKLRIKQKEAFLKQNIPEIIRDNVKTSLCLDNISLERNKMYALKDD